MSGEARRGEACAVVLRYYGAGIMKRRLTERPRATVRESAPRGPRLAPHRRQRCAVCGVENVAHTAEGSPFAVHVRARPHAEALARSKREGESAIIPGDAEVARGIAPVAAGGAPA